MKPQQNRQRDVALAQLVHQLFQIDADLGILRGMHGHVPVGVDRKVTVTPLLNAVQLCAVSQRPAFCRATGWPLVSARGNFVGMSSECDRRNQWIQRLVVIVAFLLLSVCENQLAVARVQHLLIVSEV